MKRALRIDEDEHKGSLLIRWYGDLERDWILLHA